MSAKEEALRKRAQLLQIQLRDQLGQSQQQQEDSSFIRMRERPEQVGEGGVPGGLSPSATPFDRAATVPSDVTREPVSEVASRAGTAVRKKHCYQRVLILQLLGQANF